MPPHITQLIETELAKHNQMINEILGSPEQMVKLGLYAHRNGETEPPTVKGHYWFLGKHSKQVRSYPNRRDILYVYSSGMTMYRKPKTVYARMMPISELQGQWWGPVTAPWDKLDIEQETI